MSNSSKERFPVLGANRDAMQSVPWSFIAPHSDRAEKNHGQTLERLAQRGGLSAPEMLAVVLDLSWNDIDYMEDVCTPLLELLVDCRIGGPEGRKDVAKSIRVLIVLKAAAQYLSAKKEGV